MVVGKHVKKGIMFSGFILCIVGLVLAILSYEEFSSHTFSYLCRYYPHIVTIFLIGVIIVFTGIILVIYGGIKE
jgi:uncharacterized membrane protein